MIRAVLPRRDGGITIFLGLSSENVTRMVHAEPIRAELTDLKLPRMPHDIVIVYGATEADIVAQLRAAGVQLPPGVFDAPVAPGTRVEYDGASRTVEVHPNPPSERNPT